jgi:long-chain acyl-CoA synthetase
VTTCLRGSVEFWAERTPDAPALAEGSRKLSYAQWNAQADALADLLAERAGVGSGDRVALCMQNRIEWFVTMAAAAKLDALLVPISFRLTPSEIHYIAADSGAKALLFDSEQVDALARVWTDEPPSDRKSHVRVALSVMRSAREDVLSFQSVVSQPAREPRVSVRIPRSIVYTSGTTGRPRGVVHGPPRQIERTPAERERVEQERKSRMRDVLRNLLGAPLNHAAGQASARLTHYIGGCVYIMPRFDPREALAVIAREQITTTFMVPTMLNRIVSLPDDVRSQYSVASVKVLTTGASPCPQSIKERVIAYFGRQCLIESYGTTEVGIIARMFPDDHLRKPGACGRLIEGVEVEIRDATGSVLPRGDIGEIWVRTPVMIATYLNEAPPKELVNGFFATGDVGRFDEDDYLYVVDRKKDMIIAGGVNIYPAEIEDALRRHPAVVDVAAFGVPHAELGEQVRAAVELNDGARVSEAELLEFLEQHLAAYKRPRAIDFLREIPRNPAGKILKNELRAPFWANTGKQI